MTKKKSAPPAPEPHGNWVSTGDLVRNGIQYRKGYPWLPSDGGGPPGGEPGWVWREDRDLPTPTTGRWEVGWVKNQSGQIPSPGPVVGGHDYLRGTDIIDREATKRLELEVLEENRRRQAGPRPVPDFSSDEAASKTRVAYAEWRAKGGK
jgi:hypothetical protein